MSKLIKKSYKIGLYPKPLLVLGLSVILIQGCASLPFGKSPLVLRVDHSTINDQDLTNWYDAHRYKRGYWFNKESNGTYLLVSLGKQETDYSIQSTGIKRISDEKINLDLAIDPVDKANDEPVFYPHKLYLIQPRTEKRQIIIREHQQKTVKKLKEKNEKLAVRNKQLKQENERLARQMADLKEARDFLKQKLSDSQTRITRQENKISGLKQSRKTVRNNLQNQMQRNEQLKERIQTLQNSISDLNRELKVAMKNNRTLKQEASQQKGSAEPALSLKFDSAEYKLSQQQKNNLSKLIDQLPNRDNVSLSVIGSSDTRTVSSKKLKNNLYLSTLRAWSVTKYLINSTPVDMHNVVLIASAPLNDSNGKPADQMRRVEIHNLNEQPVRIR